MQAFKFEKLVAHLLLGLKITPSKSQISRSVMLINLLDYVGFLNLYVCTGCPSSFCLVNTVKLFPYSTGCFYTRGQGLMMAPVDPEELAQFQADMKKHDRVNGMIG